MFQRPGKTRVIRYLYTPYRGRVQVNVAKIAFQQSEALSALCARFSPFNSGFSRKAREKHLAFQVGLYSSYSGHITVDKKLLLCVILMMPIGSARETSSMTAQQPADHCSKVLKLERWV